MKPRFPQLAKFLQCPTLHLIVPTLHLHDDGSRQPSPSPSPELLLPCPESPLAGVKAPQICTVAASFWLQARHGRRCRGRRLVGTRAYSCLSEEVHLCGCHDLVPGRKTDMMSLYTRIICSREFRLTENHVLVLANHWITKGKIEG
jgi:hypothetical protein